MFSNITNLVLSLGLILALAFAPLGCGGAEEEAVVAPPKRIPERLLPPDDVVEALTDCVSHGAERLVLKNYAIIFELKATEDGLVGLVKINDSLIGDQGVEACMVRVLQGMTLPASTMAMRSSRRVSEGVVAPGSREFIGTPLVVVGPTVALGPIVLVAAGITVVVLCTIYVVDELTHTTADPPVVLPAPTTATMPTTTATPITTSVPIPTAAEIRGRCDASFYECLNNRWQPQWNREDFGNVKDCRSCFRECLRETKWPDYKCPYPWQTTGPSQK